MVSKLGDRSSCDRARASRDLAGARFGFVLSCILSALAIVGAAEQCWATLGHATPRPYVFNRFQSFSCSTFGPWTCFSGLPILNNSNQFYIIHHNTKADSQIPSTDFSIAIICKYLQILLLESFRND